MQAWPVSRQAAVQLVTEQSASVAVTVAAALRRRPPPPPPLPQHPRPQIPVPGPRACVSCMRDELHADGHIQSIHGDGWTLTPHQSLRSLVLSTRSAAPAFSGLQNAQVPRQFHSSQGWVPYSICQPAVSVCAGAYHLATSSRKFHRLNMPRCKLVCGQKGWLTARRRSVSVRCLFSRSAGVGAAQTASLFRRGEEGAAFEFRASGRPAWWPPRSFFCVPLR